MGGHSAWRKRVASGELAKKYSGAIARHRPHLGRKGKDLIKNRKGHIGGGNPKKKIIKLPRANDDEDQVEIQSSLGPRFATTHIHAVLLVVCLGVLSLILAVAASKPIKSLEN
jgi:hypothetical protein